MAPPESESDIFEWSVFATKQQAAKVSVRRPDFKGEKALPTECGVDKRLGVLDRIEVIPRPETPVALCERRFS
jgi:hypothetical protein